MPRCFIALPLPLPRPTASAPALGDALVQALAVVAEAAPRAKRPHPADLHLTLRFLGETPAKGVSAIAAAVEKAASGCTPVEVGVVGAGTFGARHPLLSPT